MGKEGNFRRSNFGERAAKSRGIFRGGGRGACNQEVLFCWKSKVQEGGGKRHPKTSAKQKEVILKKTKGEGLGLPGQRGVFA